MMPMRYSKQGAALTERFEGYRSESYQDQHGIWTIGYGHTRGVIEGMSCDQAQAEAWRCEDTAAAESAVNHMVRVPMTQGEFDALVDFVFNLGAQAFSGSTLLRLLNAGNYAAAADEFAKWDHCGGKEVAGLLRRRLAEKAEFAAANA